MPLDGERDDQFREISLISGVITAEVEGRKESVRIRPTIGLMSERLCEPFEGKVMR